MPPKSVAVMVALSSLISGLQASLIARTLGTQAHIVLRPAEDVAHPALARDRDEQGQPRAMVSRIEPRVQRLRSIDQWQKVRAQAERVPDVVAVTPIVWRPSPLNRSYEKTHGVFVA